MKNFYVMLLLGIAMTILSCNKKVETTDKADEATAVKTLIVSYHTGSNADTYVGVIEESQSIPLSFLTTGTIERVFIDEGEAVDKGQLLATLNSFSYKNAYEIALAKETQAQDAYNRLSAVYKNGSLPEVKMVEIETALQQAHSLVMLAKKNLEDCNIYSPANGMVGRRAIEPGMNVIPGTAVITIVKINKVYVKVSVPENEIPEIKLGQEAAVRVAALNNELFKGKIELKGVMANPLSHTYETKIALVNRGNKLRPGMVCNVAIANDKTTGRISIPQQAVQIDNKGNKFVYVADTTNNVAVRKFIDAGTLLGNGYVEINSGLEKGDRVITDGYQKINENASVHIIL